MSCHPQYLDLGVYPSMDCYKGEYAERVTRCECPVGEGWIRLVDALDDLHERKAIEFKSGTELTQWQIL